MTRTLTTFFFALSFVVSSCGPGTSSTDDAGRDAFAASTDDAFVEPMPSCEMIIGRCHDVDPGSGPIHDCHETAHDGESEAACAAILDDCLMLCNAVDAGVSDQDAGAHMH